tara:strand:- start:1501 stop:6282 length:4782 start_codon:yes stop_codon:yes gene_type:complete
MAEPQYEYKATKEKPEEDFILPNSLDPFLNSGYKARKIFNQNPKAHPDYNKKGEMDHAGVWYDLAQNIKEAASSGNKNAQEVINSVSSVYGENWVTAARPDYMRLMNDAVGKKIKFNEKGEKVKMDKPELTALTFAPEVVIGMEREAVELLQLPFVATNYFEASLVPKPIEQEVLNARNDYLEKFKKVPTIGMGPGGVGIVPIDVPMSKDEERKAKLDIYRRYVNEGGNLSEQELYRIIEGEDFEKNYRGRSAKVIDALENVKIDHITSDLSFENDWSVGEVAGFDLASGIASGNLYSSLGRQLAKSSMKGNLKGPAYRNPFNVRPVQQYFAGGVDDVRALSFIKSTETSNVVNRVAQFVFNPILRPVAVANDVFKIKAGENAFKHVRRRAIKYAQNNPSAAKEIAFYSGVSIVGAEFIEQSLDQYNYSIPFFGDLGDTEFQSTGAFGQFGLGLVTMLGVPAAGKLVIDGLIRNLGPQFVFTPFQALAAVMRTDEGTDLGQGIINSANVMDKFGELLTWEIDALEAGSYGVSANWYNKLPEVEKNQVRELIGGMSRSKDGRKMRAFLSSIVQELRKKGMNNPEQMNMLFKNFEINMRTMNEHADFLKTITNPNGTRKYSDEFISDFTGMTIGHSMGLPYFKGIDDLLRHQGAGTFQMGITKNAAKEVVKEGFEAAHIKYMSQQEKFALVTREIMADIKKQGGFTGISTELADFYTGLQRYGETALRKYDRDIALSLEVDKKLTDNIAENKLDANMENNAQAEAYVIDAMDVDGVDLDTSTIFYNTNRDADLLNNASILDSRVSTALDNTRVDDAGVLTVKDRATHSLQTGADNDLFLGSVIDILLENKNSRYAAAYTNFQGKPLYMSKTDFNNSVNTYNKNNNISLSSRKYRPKEITITGDQSVRINTQGLDHFVKQGKTEINSINKSIDILSGTDPVENATKIKNLENKKAKINNKIEEINAAKESDNYLTSNEISGNLVKGILDNKELQSLLDNFKVYELEEIQQLVNKSTSNLMKRTLNSAIDEYDGLDLMSYVLGEDNLIRVFGEDMYDSLSKNLKNSNTYYKTNVAPVIKSRVGSNYRHNSDLGQRNSSFQDKDLLLDLINQTSVEDLGRIFEEVTESGNLNFKLSNDIVVTAENFDEIFMQLVKQRISEKGLLKLPIKVDIEKLEMLNTDKTFGQYFSNAEYQAATDLQGRRKVTTKHEPTTEDLALRAEEVGAAKRSRKDAENILGGRLRNASSAKEFFDGLDLVNQKLAKTNVYTEAGMGKPTNIIEEVKIMPANEKAAFGQLLMDYTRDTYFGLTADTLTTTTVLSGGRQLQVPELFLALYRNEELYIETIGLDAYDQLVKLTIQAAHKYDQGASIIDVQRASISERAAVLATERKLTKSKFEGPEAPPSSGLADNIDAFYKDEVEAGRILEMDAIDAPMSISVSGVAAEAGTQVISSRFFNVARGLVSPQFVGLEFMLKSIPRAEFRILAKAFQNPMTAKIVNDMFFKGNFSGYTKQQIWQAKRLWLYFAVGINDFNPEIYDSEEGFLSIDSITKDGKTRLTTEEEKLAIVQDMANNVLEMSDEEFTKLVQETKEEGLLQPVT